MNLRREQVAAVEHELAGRERVLEREAREARAELRSAMLVISILLGRLGGSADIGVSDLVAAEDDVLYRTDVSGGMHLAAMRSFSGTAAS